MNPKSVRKIALEILLSWEERKSDVSSLLDRAIREEQIQDIDKALLTELVYGVLRWRGRLDYIIKMFVHSRHNLDDVTLNILRLGAYQLIITDKIPPYAAINESVELAKPKCGRKNLVNAVLRASQRNQTEIEYPNKDENPIQYLSLRYSYPEWMVARWIKQHGVDWTAAFCEASNQVAPLCVRTNTLLTNRDALAELLKQEGVEVDYSVIVPEGLRLRKYPTLTQLSAYKRGWFSVQDESSMLTSYILDPQPEEFIIDVCAAPGGKTTHIAQIMQNRGKIVAFDISESKLSLIKENCQRLGVEIVTPMKVDASVIHNPFINKADRVLADVPCSNLGILRRHPEIRWRKTESQIIALSELQYKILKSASNYLKPNGILVYSTCSTEPEENEQVVMRFLSEHPNFEIENVVPFLPIFNGRRSENLESETGYMQTYPHLHDMDGFFVARMKRSG
ncbi:16S rRNA (cytosine(967)-C(5))-methyltransferase RsmB [Candidatus Poribacteria bacterium]|nr:16S rRNA (cytosine(967)-C(5))-methyltransferase RsmB [Candidatus Poribacteria bacterium]